MAYTPRSLKSRANVNKIYLPQNKRENQYLLAELKISDDFMASLAMSGECSDWKTFSQQAANIIFDLCAQHKIRHACVIANNKLPRVRFSHELQVWETAQQLLYLYDPARHFGYRRFLSGDESTKKIRILFLATGDDLYHQAAAFNRKVVNAVKAMCEKFKLNQSSVRFRDHQHLTWDLFARDKSSDISTRACKIRTMEYLYKKEEVTLPSSPLTYAIATLPMTLTLSENCIQSSLGERSIKQFYQDLFDHFCSVCQQNELPQATMVANGHFPIIRKRDDALQTDSQELVKIDFNPAECETNINLICDHEFLANDVHLLFFTTQHEADDNGYGSYLQKVEKALLQLAKRIELDTTGNELMIRFHQHLDVNLSQY